MIQLKNYLSLFILCCFITLGTAQEDLDLTSQFQDLYLAPPDMISNATSVALVLIQGFSMDNSAYSDVA